MPVCAKKRSPENHTFPIPLLPRLETTHKPTSRLSRRGGIQSRLFAVCVHTAVAPDAMRAWGSLCGALMLFFRPSSRCRRHVFRASANSLD